MQLLHSIEIVTAKTEKFILFIFAQHWLQFDKQLKSIQPTGRMSNQIVSLSLSSLLFNMFLSLLAHPDEVMLLTQLEWGLSLAGLLLM